ncbi:hypothetical protein ACFL6I_08660 [candidate division KSB1 bacterium]
MVEIKATWEYCGTHSNKIELDRMGTFIYMFRGIPKRIIYVGTCHSRLFHVEWATHTKNMWGGKYTIWRASVYEDIYNLISYHNEPDMVEYYKKLGKYLMVWCPKDDSGSKNMFNDKDSFESNWEDYIRNYYQPNIDIWACALSNHQDIKNENLKHYAEILESQIQVALGKHFCLGYYKTEGPTQNWLGKQQIKDKDTLFSVKFTFENLPDVDSQTAMILRNLHAFI